MTRAHEIAQKFCESAGCEVMGNHNDCALVKAITAAVAEERKALSRWLIRLKAERDMIKEVEVTVKLDPKIHGMDALIPILEAVLGTGKEAG